MRFILTFILCVWILPAATHAQSQEPSKIETPPIRDPMKFDEWSDLPFSLEKIRLDNVALQLKQAPFTAYLVIVMGKRACVGEARSRAIRAKNYLVHLDGIDPKRIVWADEGYMDVMSFQVWLLPPEM